MTHLRGLHETGGLHALRILRARSQPAKLTARLARLDHQRCLLERQLAVWTQKRQVTERRLHLVEKQMAEIGQLVRVLAAPRRANGRKPATVLPRAEQADDASAVAPHKLVNLEY